jgi:hypothetical protein
MSLIVDSAPSAGKPSASAQRRRTDTVVQPAQPVDVRARSAPGPCRSGRARASTVTNGSDEPQVIAPPARQQGRCTRAIWIVVPMMRFARRGSRRAATDRRRDQRDP